MSEPSTDLRRVADALRSITVPIASEAQLQQLIAEHLAAAGIKHGREVTLVEGRIDFLCDSGIGIEVKVAGPRNAVIRQLLGYAQDDRVRGLLLCTTRAAHRFAAEDLNGKPFAIVHLRGWL